MEQQAAQTTSFIILRQAKIDGQNPLEFLDKIRNFTDVQLTDLIGEILNNNRVPTSTIGRARPKKEINPATRNIFT